jgi:putative membrane protein
MFLWSQPIGKKIFNMCTKKVNITQVFAANQGLYNGLFSV